MERRRFITLATVAAVAGVQPAAASTPQRGVKRVFRRDATGTFRCIAWQDVREGDRIILIGETDGELWCCETYTVHAVVTLPDMPGEVGFIPDYETRNHSDCLHAFYDAPLP